MFQYNKYVYTNIIITIIVAYYSSVYKVIIITVIFAFEKHVFKQFFKYIRQVVFSPELF